MLVNIRLKICFVIFLIGVFCCNCKKNQDQVPPSIVIQMPLSNSSFDLPNSIRIKGTVSDNNLLQNIEIGILDENLSAIVTDIHIELNDQEYSFDETITLDNRLIESGNYYISVKAFDHQNNQNSSYQEITLSEIPKKFESLYIVTPTFGYTNLISLDSNGITELKYSLQGGFQKAIANSRHQYFFIGTDQIGNAVESNYFSAQWSVTPYLSPYEFFSEISLSEFGDQMHIVYGDGVIKSYNKNGNIVNTIYCNDQEWFGKAFKDDNVVVAEVFSSATSRFLAAFFRTSGIEYQRIQIQGEVIKIGKISNERYFFIVKNQNITKIYNYDISTNITWLENDLLVNNVYDAIFLENKLFLATNQGLIKYNYQTSSQLLVSNSIPFYEIKYESLSGSMVLNAGKQIWLYDQINTPTLMHSLSDSICQIMLLYNK